MSRRVYKVIFINGDGIGPELMTSALTVLRSVESKFRSVKFDIDFHPGGAEYFKETGINLNPATLKAIKNAHATMKGPVGLPDVRFPDGTEAGVLGGVLRTGLDTWHERWYTMRFVLTVSASLEHMSAVRGSRFSVRCSRF